MFPLPFRIPFLTSPTFQQRLTTTFSTSIIICLFLLASRELAIWLGIGIASSGSLSAILITLAPAREYGSFVGLFSLLLVALMTAAQLVFAASLTSIFRRYSCYRDSDAELSIRDDMHGAFDMENVRILFFTPGGASSIGYADHNTLYLRSDIADLLKSSDQRLAKGKDFALFIVLHEWAHITSRDILYTPVVHALTRIVFLLSTMHIYASVGSPYISSLVGGIPVAACMVLTIFMQIGLYGYTHSKEVEADRTALAALTRIRGQLAVENAVSQLRQLGHPSTYLMPAALASHPTAEKRPGVTTEVMKSRLFAFHFCLCMFFINVVTEVTTSTDSLAPINGILMWWSTLIFFCIFISTLITLCGNPHIRKGINTLSYLILIGFVFLIASLYREIIFPQTYDNFSLYALIRGATSLLAYPSHLVLLALLGICACSIKTAKSTDRGRLNAIRRVRYCAIWVSFAWARVCLGIGVLFLLVASLALYEGQIGAILAVPLCMGLLYNSLAPSAAGTFISIMSVFTFIFTFMLQRFPYGYADQNLVMQSIDVFVAVLIILLSITGAIERSRIEEFI